MKEDKESYKALKEKLEAMQKAKKQETKEEAETEEETEEESEEIEEPEKAEEKEEPKKITGDQIVNSIIDLNTRVTNIESALFRRAI